MQNYSIQFLCWIDRCLFPVNLRNELIALGVEEGISILMSDFLSHRVRANNAASIVTLYQEFIDSEGVCKELDVYLAARHQDWRHLQSRSLSLADAGWNSGEPSEDYGTAWLLLECFHPDGNTRSVMLAVRDDDGLWSEACSWVADDYCEIVTDTIIGWQPYVMPVVPRA